MQAVLTALVGCGKVGQVHAAALAGVEGQDRPLRASMGGRAEVVVGRQSLVRYAFAPPREF